MAAHFEVSRSLMESKVNALPLGCRETHSAHPALWATQANMLPSSPDRDVLEVLILSTVRSPFKASLPREEDPFASGQWQPPAFDS